MIKELGGGGGKQRRSGRTEMRGGDICILGVDTLSA